MTRKKSMQVLFILVAGNVLAAFADSPTGHAEPTEYVMQFLKRSKTLFLERNSWKEQLRNNEKTRIRTAYSFFSDGKLEERFGYSARPFSMKPMPGNGVRSYFEVEKDGQKIEIDAFIQDQVMLTELTEDEIKELEAKGGFVEKEEEEEITVSDECTTCKYVTVITLLKDSSKPRKSLHPSHPPTGASYKKRVRMVAECKSNMATERFEALLNEK